MSKIYISWFDSFKIFYSILWRSFIYTTLILILIVLLIIATILLIGYINPELLVSLGAIYTMNIYGYFISLDNPSFSIEYISIYIIINIFMFIILLFISKKVLTLKYKKFSIKLIDNQNGKLLEPSFKNSFKFTFYYFIILTIYNLITQFIQIQYINIYINNINYTWSVLVWIGYMLLNIYAIKKALEYRYRDFSISLVSNKQLISNENVENENVENKSKENIIKKK